MSDLYWSGIGNREATDQAISDLTHISRKLNAKGLGVRSGGRGDCDTASERGTPFNKQIFYPKHDYRYHYGLPTLDESYTLAKKYHDAWDYLPEKYRNYFARNAHIVLGADLKLHSEFVVCWTRDGVYDAVNRTKKTGGTGHAIAIACNYGIPVFNINNKIQREYVMDFLINFDFSKEKVCLY